MASPVDERRRKQEGNEKKEKGKMDSTEKYIKADAKLQLALKEKAVSQTAK